VRRGQGKRQGLTLDLLAFLVLLRVPGLALRGKPSLSPRAELGLLGCLHLLNLYLLTLGQGESGEAGKEHSDENVSEHENLRVLILVKKENYHTRGGWAR